MRVGKVKLLGRCMTLFIAIAQCTKCTVTICKVVGSSDLTFGSGSLLGSMSLLALEAFTFAFVAYGAVRTWDGRFSAQRSSDWTLGLASFIAPTFNITAHFSGALPGFVVHKNFMAFHCFITVILAMMLPPAHALMHWAIASPAYV